MKKLILAVVTFAAVIVPASSADAHPKHHHDGGVTVQRAIDWD